ncbi:hypothetical protein [Bradyrhizobium jicamae]|nr:hypothetical protein [Bradyrhizobium jicamae]
MWRRRRSRLDALAGRVEELEHRLDRVAIRQCVSEVMLATAVAFVLRAVGEDLLSRLMNELRKNVSATASRQTVALEMEERAAQLLDQIEYFARLPQTTDGTRH